LLFTKICVWRPRATSTKEYSSISRSLRNSKISRHFGCRNLMSFCETVLSEKNNCVNVSRNSSLRLPKQDLVQKRVNSLLRRCRRNWRNRNFGLRSGAISV
jgi:hypothetical protein